MSNIQGFERLGQIASSQSAKSAQAAESTKLKYSLGVYAAPRVADDNFSLSSNKVKKSAFDNAVDQFLYKYNPNGLLAKYTSKEALEKMLDNAPEIKNILQQKGVANPVANVNNLNNIKESHIKTTVDIATALADELNLSNEDKQAVSVGSLFHDFGKIMMPEEILNKNGKLSPEERSIINTHSKIGYEMLKSIGMNSKVLSIVANHHTPANKTADFLPKIVSVADVYSALTEKRAYKEPLSQEQTFGIMRKAVDEGKLDGNIVNVLENYLNKQESIAS